MVIKERERNKGLILDLDKLPLGKRTTYPKKYDPSLLVGISRQESRTRSAISIQDNPFYGLDSWTAYELSWLDIKGYQKMGFCTLPMKVVLRNLLSLSHSSYI